MRPVRDDRASAGERVPQLLLEPDEAGKEVAAGIVHGHGESGRGSHTPAVSQECEKRVVADAARR